MDSKNILIVGVDSEIGSELKKLTLKNGFEVEGTSRRKEFTSKNISFFDLEEPNFESIDMHFECVIICAAITNITQCEENPNLCKRVNLINTIRLIDNAVANNSFVIFLSSNTVFDGTQSFYKHYDETNPISEYGKCKKAVEEYLINNINNKGCVIRFTKVISKKTPFIESWESDAEKGLSVQAYSNKLISSISIGSAVSAIQLLINTKKSGIFQLGGAEEVSYLNFAQSYFKGRPNALKLIEATKVNTNAKSLRFNSLSTYLPLEKSFNDSNVFFAKHQDSLIIDEISEIISSIFTKTTAFYAEMPIDNYRKLVIKTQNILNEQNFTRKIVNKIKSDITNYLQEEKFLIQTNLYLRATRPIVSQSYESISWHRESFYGPNMENALNIWTPIQGVDVGNTLKFIPNSQKIPENDIETIQEDDFITKKGSSGHKIGFLYSPKTIVGGVDLENERPMVVPRNHSSLFPGALIHGSSINYSSEIRFSIDFRILSASAYDSSQSKKFHLASNKPYFELF